MIVIKKILALLILLCLVLSLFACGSRGNGGSSETPQDSGSGDGTPPESSGDDGTDPPPTPQVIEPSVGYYEIELEGVLLRVDFWDVPTPWFENRIEGTLSYTNNTGAELSRYLHAAIDIFGEHYYSDELTHSDTPEIVQSEEYGTLTAEAPLLLDLASGETVTVNFSVELPHMFELPECSHYLTFGLSENDEFLFRETSYRLCFRVKA